MRGKSYICDCCKKEFAYEEDWTEEDANEEAEALLGVKEAGHKSEMAQVCDDCFKAMMTSANN